MTPMLKPPKGAEILRNGPLPLVPQIVYIPEFLSPEMCDKYRIMGRRMEALDATTLTHDGERSVDKQFRNCTYRAPGNDHFIELLAEIKAVTDWRWFEDFSLQCYPEYGYVKNHQDYNPGLPNQRHATLITYLNDNFEGGDTVFPKLKLRVPPKKGAALFFNYVPDETISSFHRGERVMNGQKWIITSWFIEKETK